MKKRILLSESKLSNIIKNVIKEETKKKSGLLFENILCESMIFPRRVKRIWWDGKETFVILGSDNCWYSVYPNFGDAYKDDNKMDKIFQTYADNIIKAYANNGIRPDVLYYNWEGKPQIIDDTWENEKYFDKINRWLNQKGFALTKRADRSSEYNYNISNIWTYQGEYQNDANDPEQLQRVANMQDVTREVIQFFNNGNGPKEQSRSALSYLLDNEDVG